MTTTKPKRGDNFVLKHFVKYARIWVFSLTYVLPYKDVLVSGKYGPQKTSSLAYFTLSKQLKVEIKRHTNNRRSQMMLTLS